MTHVRSHQAIHQSLSEEGNQHKPFGGKQVILVGELLQLRPVPDDLDEGMFMFYSPLFGSAITHRFELTEIMRQFDNFLSALQDVRVGKCSNETQNFLNMLTSSLPRDKRTPKDVCGEASLRVISAVWKRKHHRGPHNLFV